MEQVIYTVKLDLTDNGCFDSGWRIKQGDNANSYLKVKVENNGVVYFNPLNLPEIVFHRPDGSTVVSVMSAGTDDFYTYTIVGNELAVAGNVVMDVKFTDSGRTSTASCTFLCVPDTISGDPSGASTYYNPISELIDQGEQIIEETEDNRLISEGYARGTQDGEEVSPGSPYYHNNAKYYMEQSSEVSNITWDRVQNKPFNTIGNNLTVDQNGTLNAPAGLTELEELYDVNINGPANGQVLAYNASTQKWINSNSGGGGGLLPHLIVTTTTGSTVTATKGLTVVTLTETSTGQFEADIPEFGTWDIEASLSGSTATYTLTVDTVKIYSVSLGYFNATITVTFPANSTCSCGKTGETPQTASVSPHTFTVHSVGMYTITATDGTHTKSDTVTITTDGQSESVTLSYVPDGSTVTPTDDIQTWLACGGITDKNYTTLSEVLADSTTLSALIADSNAVDYMVRSKTWANDWNDVCTEQTHTFSGTSSTDVTLDSLSGTKYRLYMTAQSSNGAGSGLKLQFYDSNNTALVPNMTSATAPSGTVSQSNQLTNYEAWKAFSTSQANGWFAQNSIGYGADDYIGYEFTSAVNAAKATISMVNANSTTLHFKIQKYTSSITEDSTAMTYIGLNNYCANTLLADSDWLEAICNSQYLESVLNIKVPVMTSNTTPSGECSATSSASGNEPYKAFDGNDSSFWYAGTTQSTLVQGIKCVIYDFGSNVKIYACHAHLTSYSDTNRTDTVKVLGSTTSTESDYVTLKEESLTVNGIASGAEIGTFKYLLSNVGNYRYYAYGGISQASTTPPFERINTLQFYGRQDV